MTPQCQLLPPVRPFRRWLLGLLLASGLTLSASHISAVADDARQESSVEQPAVVIAAAGVDRLLEAVDYVFESAGHAQVAQFVRGFLANFNNLQGLDRTRPIGVYLFLRPEEGEQPQPVIFLPVADVDQLIGSVRFGPLRLKRGDSDDRLTLVTEDGEIPAGLAHGYAFLDPVGRGRWIEGGVVDPAQIMGDLLDQHDAAVLVRREGFSQAVVDKVLTDLRTGAAKEAEKRPGESDEEYSIRKTLTETLLGTIEQFLQQSHSLSAGFRLSPETRKAELTIHLQTPADRELGTLLSSIDGRGSVFADQLGDPAPFTVASCWRLTSGGRDILSQVLDIARGHLENEVGQADAVIRATAEDVLDAIESSIEDGRFDGFLQIVGGPPNAFALVGAARVADAETIGTGLERFLPFANESPDVAEMEMNVVTHQGVAIHRVKPRKMRRQDQRLYGGGASFYIGAGQGAVWFALGEEDALTSLTDSMDRAAEATTAAVSPPADSRPLLEVTTHLTSWIGLAPTGGNDKNARIAALAREAFADPEQDRFHAELRSSADGLRLLVALDEGYIRMLGLAVASQMNRR